MMSAALSTMSTASSNIRSQSSPIPYYKIPLRRWLTALDAAFRLLPVDLAGDVVNVRVDLVLDLRADTRGISCGAELRVCSMRVARHGSTLAGCTAGESEPLCTDKAVLPAMPDRRVGERCKITPAVHQDQARQGQMSMAPAVQPDNRVTACIADGLVVTWSPCPVATCSSRSSSPWLPSTSTWSLVQGPPL
jgi:hypothetical protein